MSCHNVTGSYTPNFNGTVTIHSVGGGGGVRSTANTSNRGGGGSSYAGKNNLSVSSGVAINFTIGAAGTYASSPTAGGDTTVTYNSVTQTVAKGGGPSSSSGLGGTAAASTGDVKYDGGNAGQGAQYFDGEFSQWYYWQGGGGGPGGSGGPGGAGSDGYSDGSGGGWDGSTGSWGAGDFLRANNGVGGGPYSGGVAGAVELQFTGLPKIARRLTSVLSTDNTAWTPAPGSHFSGAAISAGTESYWVVIVGADGTPTLTETGGNGWTKQSQQNGTGCTMAVFTKKTTEAVAAGQMPPFVLGSTASEQFSLNAFGYLPAALKTVTLLGITYATGTSTTPDPPASTTNNTGAAKVCQVIAARISDGIVGATAYPTGYGRVYQQNALSSTGVSTAAVEVERSIANGGSENPGAFTTISAAWVAATIVIYEEELAPTISPATTAFNVVENVAFSQDFNSDTTANFSIVGGTDSGKFTINAAGLLQMVAKDYDVPDDSNGDRIYQVTIRATNTGGSNLSTDKTLTVTVTSDTTPPVITPSTTAFSIPSGTAFSQDYNVAGESVTWSIISGNDAAKFSIDSAGLLSMTAKDYFSPTDSNSDNIYEVTFRASDVEGNNTDRAISVTVTPPEYYPTASSVDATGTANRTWRNLNNMYLDNTLYADLLTGLGNTHTTNIATFTGFDLSSIPDGATILGLEVIAESDAVNSSGSVTAHLDFTIKGSAAKSTTPEFGNGTGMVVYTVGGSADLWGLGPMDGATLKSGFNLTMKGVASATGAGSTNPRIDYVKVRVYYNPAVNLTAQNVGTSAPAISTATAVGVAVLNAQNIASSAPAISASAIGQTHNLIDVDIATTAPAITASVIGQRHALSNINIATTAPAIATAAIGQRHALATTNIASSAPALASATIGQRHVLSAINLATTAPAITQPTLVRGVGLTAQNITTSIPAIQTPTIGQRHILADLDIVTSAPAIALATIGQRHILADLDIVTNVPTISQSAISQKHTLTAINVVPGSAKVQVATLGVIPTQIDYARPIEDVNDDGWLTETDGTDLVNSIDEVSPNDADYIKSPVDIQNKIARFKIGGWGAQSIHGIMKLRYRLGRIGPNVAFTQTVRFYEGNTLIAGPWVHNVEGVQPFEQEIDSALITNPNNLFIEVEAA